MSSLLYRMPPLPEKMNYLRQLLIRLHAVELFVAGDGKPVLAVVMKAEQVSEYVIQVYQQLLRLVAHVEADSLAQATHLMVWETPPKPAVYHLKPDLMVDLAHHVIQRGSERISL